MKRVAPVRISAAARRDPYVELNVSGKQLTDAGFAEIAAALSTLDYYEVEDGKVVRLQALLLAGNELTAGSLPALTRIIRDSAAELRDLDLSDNAIGVSCVQDALAWEEFLGSFRGCSVLRWLDLGGNALGSWAFEILARVYGDEEPLDLVDLDDGDLDISGEGLARADFGKSSDAVGGLGKRFGKVKVVPESRDDTERSVAEAKEGTRRRGPRKGYLRRLSLLLLN